MHIKNHAIYIGILLCLLLSIKTQAQSFSYVYIQGDKETPFYVKLENEMMPRYGKNFSIISELAPGPIHVQILFQQNVYPPVNFTIQVPENGFRGFMLTRKGTEFSLFDLYYRFYLPAGNTEDRAPNRPIRTTIPASVITASETTATPPPPTVPKVVAKPKPAAPKPPVIQPKAEVTIPVVPPAKDNSQPQFMDDVTLNHEAPVKGGGIINSDCPAPLTATDFENLQRRVLERSDNDRLTLLLNRLNYCYSTQQVGMLANALASDSARFEFFKRAYARTSNQSEYPSLEKMLSTQEWKDKFKDIINPH